MTRYDGYENDWGCDWFYKGQPCKVVGVDVEGGDLGKGEVLALYVNTGVGPDIRAELKDLEYEVRKQS